jgi:hypothetical protein
MRVISRCRVRPGPTTDDVDGMIKSSALLVLVTSARGFEVKLMLENKSDC